MQKIFILLLTAFITLSLVSCSEKVERKAENVLIYSTLNSDSKVTTQSIQVAFNSVGLGVLGNNDMNNPFKSRFNAVHYDVYNLGIFMNNQLTVNLIKKYPNFGLLTPLTMSIWKGKDGSMNIAVLSIEAMSRVIGIPLNDPDLIAYSQLMDKAVKAAMPNGSYKDLGYTVVIPDKTLSKDFVVNVDLGDTDPEDYIEEFEDEFESELASVGFLFPNYTNVQENVFDDAGYTGVYDFYHTYSFCKMNVIYAVSKTHPEAGAWAPCSFYVYKKTGENKMHMGFLSVENWINSIGIKDMESIKPLQEAQTILESIINETSE